MYPGGAQSVPGMRRRRPHGLARNQSVYDGLDLPGRIAWREEGDAEGEDAGGGRGRQPHVNGVPWYWWLVGVLLLGLVVGARRFVALAIRADFSARRLRFRAVT
jgi:hypothetical protein